jgi:hypothetical protein
MSGSLFNFGPLPNADIIAKVIEHTRAINQAYINAIDERKSKAVDQTSVDGSGKAQSSDGADASNKAAKQTGKGVIA